MTSAIISTKGFLGGKPRIRGTRMSVDVINSYLSSGCDVEDIKKDYPHLTKKQIKAAMDYLDDKLHKERNKLEIQAA